MSPISKYIKLAATQRRHGITVASRASAYLTKLGNSRFATVTAQQSLRDFDSAYLSNGVYQSLRDCVCAYLTKCDSAYLTKWGDSRRQWPPKPPGG